MTSRGALADPESTIEVAREAASSLLRTSSPADAFDSLAPWVTTRGTRAQAILWELDACLTAYSTGELEVLPDPRWEAHCSALATEGDETSIRDSANAIARGLAYYRLPRAARTPPFSRLSLPDSEEDPHTDPYPLLVVGFEPAPAWTAPALGSWMPTLYDVRRHGTSEVVLVGFVLRLPRDLDAYARVLRETWPGAPAPARGSESIVVSEPAASFDTLHGMPVIYFEPRARPWEGPSFSGVPCPRSVEDAPFSRGHVDELRAAAALSGRNALRLAMVWATSD